MTKILPIIAVSCCYLLKVYLLFARLRGLGLLGFALGSSGADGAACALAAGVNHGLPRVTAWAGPPDSFVAAKGHIVRREW